MQPCAEFDLALQRFNRNHLEIGARRRAVDRVTAFRVITNGNKCCRWFAQELVRKSGCDRIRYCRHSRGNGEELDIPDAYSDSRFNPGIRPYSEFPHQRPAGITGIPIAKGLVVGVLELLNRLRPIRNRISSSFGEYRLISGLALEMRGCYSRRWTTKIEEELLGMRDRLHNGTAAHDGAGHFRSRAWKINNPLAIAREISACSRTIWPPLRNRWPI